MTFEGENRLLYVLGIALAQLLGCSLWFSVNGVSLALIEAWSIEVSAIGWLTGAVQAGFILGTLGLAVSNLADRFAASSIFLCASIIGAVANLLFAYHAFDLVSGSIYRFVVGCCLAGIYPIGMKLIVSWSPKLPGVGLGLMVGMLTLGTASPHLLNALALSHDWRTVLVVVSLFAVIGGLLVKWIGEGPHTLKQTGVIQWGAIFSNFRNARFRASACGYFGHMWELYAFWTLVPVLLKLAMPSATVVELSAWSFAVIGIGFVGSIWGGLTSEKIGSSRVAFISLGLSGVICAIYPLIQSVPGLAISLLMAWGFFVIADSAQFSAISSQACDPERVAGALSIQNSIGFLISIGSIVLLTEWIADLGALVVWLLIPGPVFGLLAMRPLLHQTDS